MGGGSVALPDKESGEQTLGGAVGLVGLSIAEAGASDRGEPQAAGELEGVGEPPLLTCAGASDRRENDEIRSFVGEVLRHGRDEGEDVGIVAGVVVAAHGDAVSDVAEERQSEGGSSDISVGFFHAAPPAGPSAARGSNASDKDGSDSSVSFGFHHAEPPPGTCGLKRGPEADGDSTDAGSANASDLSLDAAPQRRNRRRRTEEFVPEDVWKRFTPATVNKEKCRARMWSGGRGGQCSKLPIPGRDVCAMHSRSASHGLVTGAIPYDKLQEFLRAEEAARKRVAKGEGVTAGGKLRADRRKRHWCARYLLWAEAEKLDAQGRQAERGPMHLIDDQGDAEFTGCL